MDPFKEFTHGGTLNVAEILFHTRFNYMFPLLAANPNSTLAPGATTQGALLALGTAIATDTGAPTSNSTIPAILPISGSSSDLSSRDERKLFGI